MSETDDQNREARMRAILNADGSVTPAAELLPGLLTPEEQHDLEAEFDGALSVDHAELRLPIETIEDFDRAVAELPSRTDADVVSEASRLLDEASAAEAMERSNRSFGVQAAADAEADRL